MDIRKIFEYALQREYEGKAFFDLNASRLQNAAAAGAFKAIAGEEQKHIEFILAQINALDLEKTAPVPDIPKTGFFADRAASENIEQSTSEAMVADLPVLRMAYLIERDFTEFYTQAASKAEGTQRSSWKCWQVGKPATNACLRPCMTGRSNCMPGCLGVDEPIHSQV